MSSLPVSLAKQEVSAFSSLFWFILVIFATRGFLRMPYTMLRSKISSHPVWRATVTAFSSLLLIDPWFHRKGLFGMLKTMFENVGASFCSQNRKCQKFQTVYWWALYAWHLAPGIITTISFKAILLNCCKRENNTNIYINRWKSNLKHNSGLFQTNMLNNKKILSKVSNYPLHEWCNTHNSCSSNFHCINAVQVEWKQWHVKKLQKLQGLQIACLWRQV